MPEFDLKALPKGEPYKIVASLVVPRPIAWIVTRNAETGVVNVAPFSFFNLLGSDPLVVGIGVSPMKGRIAEPKDTARNLSVIGTGFVVHLVDEAHAERMNTTSSELSSSESEASLAGLTLTESATVAQVPRIADAPAALECRVAEIAHVGNNRIILAEVVYVHLRDDLWDVGARHVLTADAHFIGRMDGGGWYTRTSERFHMVRPK